jgi:hypothetical protein
MIARTGACGTGKIDRSAEFDSKDRIAGTGECEERVLGQTAREDNHERTAVEGKKRQWPEHDRTEQLGQDIRDRSPVAGRP